MPGASKKAILFDLFDTLLIKKRFDYDVVLDRICYHLRDVPRSELEKNALAYRGEYMGDRSITNREASFLHQLQYYEHRCDARYDVGYSDLEWECFKSCRTEVLAEDACMILAYLKMREYSIGVVSNSIFSSSTLSRYLGEFGIGGYFDEVLSSADVGYRKPSPKIFQCVCDKMGVRPDSRVMHVGNKYSKDVMGAASAGLTPILLAGTSPNNYSCTSIRSLAELIPIIEEAEANYAHSD